MLCGNHMATYKCNKSICCTTQTYTTLYIIYVAIKKDEIKKLIIRGNILNKHKKQMRRIFKYYSGMYFLS